MSVPAEKLVQIARSDDQGIPEIPRTADVVRAAMLTAADGASEDNFGKTVAMSGSTVVVGSPHDTVAGHYQQGSAYVYVRAGANWIQQAKLTATDGEANDQFGSSVAVNGDRIVVGAPMDDVGGAMNQGSAYVFTRTGGAWTSEIKLLQSDGSANDSFGNAVAVDGDTVAVGAVNDDHSQMTDAGSVYVFEKILGSWDKQTYLTAFEARKLDYFGMSVALSGDTLVVGAPYDDFATMDQGSAFVFTRTAGVWTQDVQLVASDASPSDYFGWSVAVSGNSVVVGSPNDDILYNTDQGSVHIFVRATALFIEQAKLTAYEGGADDWFGASVGLDGDVLVVGAPGDDYGTNYDQGSVYVSVRVGDAWPTELKILVAGGAPSDDFGYSVAVSGQSIVGGAPEDSVGSNLYQGSAFIVEFQPTTEADFDGDGLSDMSVFRPNGSTGQAEWWFASSAVPGNYGAVSFGSAADIPVPADYTGDGKTDAAFFRPANGYWYVLRSEDLTFYAFPFGISGDVPAPGDYDGDGKADVAVFRGSTGVWYARKSSDAVVTFANFGILGDKPVVADYDGDGRDDIALFRKYGTAGAEWWINRSSQGVIAFTFGEFDDIPVPGDYTGDGKADIAFFRGSNANWYVLRSNDYSYYAFPFGISSDVPAPADYDGDGKTDAAVFRQGYWYVFNSSSGSSTAAPFGLADDVPVPGILR